MNRKSKALDALFGGRQALLFAVYLEPSRWWSYEELARETHPHGGGLRRDLEELSAAGIFRCRGDGDAAQYQANAECPFFAEIQAIFAKALSRRARPVPETILLVDDQEATLKVARILLENFGYKVLAADSGQQAIILFRQHQNEIRLLLTDVLMPDISGPQLAERLRAIKPELKLIYMSGYATEAERHPGVPFLAKPFNPAGLAKTVREVLDS